MASAETWYMFRHAVLREAAYQLLVPSARGTLHEAALELLENAGAEPIELADHAFRAREARGPMITTRLVRTERQHLLAAARQAEREYRVGDAENLLRRLEAVSGTDDAAQMELGRLRTRLMLMHGNGPEAVEAAQRLLTAAEATGNDDLIAKARFEAGRTFMDTANTGRARELLTLAAAHFRKLNSRDLCSCLGSLSTATWFSESAEAALPIAAEALDLARQYGDMDAACGISINRVNMLSGLRRLPEARAALEEARQLVPKGGPGRAVMFETTAGILAFYDQRRAEAVTHYTRALELARRYGMQSEIARALTNLASLELPGVTPRISLERQAEAARIAGECGDLRLALYATQGEAEALEMIKDFEGAARRMQMARWYAETLGNRAQAETCRLRRAALMFSVPGEFGAPEEALGALRDCPPRVENAPAWISAASAIAVHLRARGQHEDARAWAARAFELGTSTPALWPDVKHFLEPLMDFAPAGFVAP